MLQELTHELWHAVTDTAKMLPFLFIAYLVIEIIEHRKSDSVERLLAKGGRFGFVPGAVLGIIPQCGFSAMAANFYASRVITLGTLIAVFLASSDEAIPILLVNGMYKDLGMLIAAKLVWAILVGFLLDFVLVKLLPASLRGGWKGKTEDVDCYEEDEEDGILLSALKHTLSVGAFVLLFTFLFGLLVEWIGQERFDLFFQSLGLLQPVMASLVGLIPNCASSVLLTTLYIDGTITFGSLLAGLCTNAGVGIMVLVRNNKSWKQNLFILGLLLLFGVAIGLVFTAIGF